MEKLKKVLMEDGTEAIEVPEVRIVKKSELETQLGYIDQAIVDLQAKRVEAEALLSNF